MPLDEVSGGENCPPKKYVNFLPWFVGFRERGGLSPRGEGYVFGGPEIHR